MSEPPDPNQERHQRWEDLIERRRLRYEELERAEREAARLGKPLNEPSKLEGSVLEKLRASEGAEINEVQRREIEEAHNRSAARSQAQRGLAVLTALLAGAATVFILSSGADYHVTAHFASAAQVVGGEQVVVGGVPIGSVENVSLGADGEALLEIGLSDKTYVPLREGTVATIRSTSLSGIANRQIQLTLPSEQNAGGAIEDGGEMSQDETISEVDLDQLFNTLDDKTAADFKKVIQGFALSYEGVEGEANRGVKYLNPFLSTSRRVFGELNRDRQTLAELLVDSDQLTGALASRRDDVAALVVNLDGMMGALARRHNELAETVHRLPDFMRNFNTTAVNLRAALDDVDPLIEASKPVADRLGPFFRRLRGASAGLVPTLKDLDHTISEPGNTNDLVDLTRLQKRLTKVAVGPLRANGQIRSGAFPESARALARSQHQLAFLRAYTPELVAWFNDFGNSGINDFNGGMGRIETTFGVFSANANGVPVISDIFNVGGSVLSASSAFGSIDQGNTRRCPGSTERPAADGSSPFTEGGTLDCDPTQLPVGP